MDIQKAIQQHRNKIELRLAWSTLYQLKVWEIDQLLRENWRWN